MRTTIIMPTIHVPPNIQDWADQLDPNTDSIIIAGNEISPHDAIESRLADLAIQSCYLHPDDEYCRSLRFNQFMEPNHHHRRNFALIKALQDGADIIITLDDDNFPAVDDWVEQVKKMLTMPNTTYTRIENEDGWVDPGNLCSPRVKHRGYPLTRRLHAPAWYEFPANGESIGVFAGLWLGDPDIDAIERIAKNPLIDRVDDTAVWGLGTWAPFDSQSTAITRELAPLLFMWPYVGRYDDIWASYLVRAVMDFRKQHIAYGKPAVRQLRNPHNLLKDLDNERLGYEFTEDLCDVLRDINFKYANNDVVSQMYLAIDSLRAQCSFIPSKTISGLEAWCDDLDDLLPDL